MEFEPCELRDDRAHEANSGEASAIVPAEPGWFMVSARVDRDGTPTSLLEERILAWMVEAKTDAMPGRLRRCSSSAWPITARIGSVQFSDDDFWGLKKPNGEYLFAETSFPDAAGCLAEFKWFAAKEAKRQAAASASPL